MYILGHQIPGARRPPPDGGAARLIIRRLGLAVLALGQRRAWTPAARAGRRQALVETEAGREVYSTPVRVGEPFTLWFLHSYDRAFFAEHYKVLGPGRILLTHMTFKSNLNGEGFEYGNFHLRADGVGELRDINEMRREVHFMIGSPDLANHTLILGGKRIPLLRFTEPQTLVSLRVLAGPEEPKGGKHP